MDRYVGIDVSKDVLAVAKLSVSGELEVLKLTNDASGHQKLLTQLEGLRCQVIFEATGPYHRQLQQTLQNPFVAVSVVNPRQALNYAKSQNRRHKTDQVDALLLAQFGLERRPSVSLSEVPAQQSIARVAALNEDLGRLHIRLEAAQRGLSHPEVVTSLKRGSGLLEEEKQRLEERL